MMKMMQNTDGITHAYLAKFNVCTVHLTYYSTNGIVPAEADGEVNNYRPVSLTCIIYKILELIIRDSIMEHFTANKLFTKGNLVF